MLVHPISIVIDLKFPSTWIHTISSIWSRRENLVLYYLTWTPYSEHVLSDSRVFVCYNLRYTHRSFRRYPVFPLWLCDKHWIIYFSLIIYECRIARWLLSSSWYHCFNLNWDWNFPSESFLIKTTTLQVSNCLNVFLDCLELANSPPFDFDSLTPSDLQAYNESRKNSPVRIKTNKDERKEGRYRGTNQRVRLIGHLFHHLRDESAVKNLQEDVESMGLDPGSYIEKY